MNTFKCSKCCVSFDVEKECEIHKMNCKGEETDDKADESNDSSSNPTGEKSRKRPSIKPLEQSHCGDEDPGPSSLSSNWSEESRNRTPTKCSYCNTTLQNSFECNRHQRECPKNKKRKTEQIGANWEDDGALSDSDFSLGCPCDNEGNDFSKGDPPYDPSAEPSTSTKPNPPSKASKGKDNDTDKPFKCQECNKSFMGRTWLNNHIGKAHKENSTSTGSSNSESGSAGATNNNNPSNPQAEANGGTPSESATQSGSKRRRKQAGTEKTFICKDCNYIFEKQSDLNNHRTYAKKKKDFRCEFNCCESFSLRANLERHHKKRHSSKSGEANNDGDNAMPEAEANGDSPAGSAEGIAGNSSEAATSSFGEGTLELVAEAEETLEEKDQSQGNNQNMNDEEEEDSASSTSRLTMDVEEDPLRTDDTASIPEAETIAETLQDLQQSHHSTLSSGAKRTLEGDEEDNNLGGKKSKTTNNENSDSDDDTEEACSGDFDPRDRVIVSGVPVSPWNKVKRPFSDDVCKVEDDEVKQEEAILPDIVSPEQINKEDSNNSRSCQIRRVPGPTMEPQQKTENEEINPTEDRRVSIIQNATQSGNYFASEERSVTIDELVSIENRDFSLKFLLKIWNVNNDASQVHYLHVEHLLREILIGIRSNSAPREVIALLKKEPEKTLGYLIMQIVIIDFMRKLNILQILKLHKEAVNCWGSGGFNVYQRMIETIAVFYLGYVKNPSLSIRKEIQENIGSFSNSNYKLVWQVITGSDEVVNATELPVGLFTETKQQNEEMVFSKLFDKSNDWNARCWYWNKLYNRIKTSLPSSRQQSLFEHVLKHSLEYEVGTVPLAKISNGSIELLHVHQEILQPYLSSESQVNDLPIIKATKEDKDTFIGLLYEGANSNLTEKVTIPVFEIAKSLNIKNIWDFLFPNGLDYEAYPGGNQKAIFEIALNVEDESAMHEIGKFFDSWIPPKTQHACLHNCSMKQVIWFLGRNYANLDEFDKYMMIMNWCHFHCKKPCPDVDEIVFDEKVHQYFKQVSSTLDYVKLIDGGRYSNILIKQGYILRSKLNNGIVSLENGQSENENAHASTSYRLHFAQT